MDFDLLEFFFRKKLTVIGIRGHTHGVRSAINPPPKPKRKMYHQGCVPISAFSSPSGKFTGAHKSVSSSVMLGSEMFASCLSSLVSVMVSLLIG